jgi:hypothetical protein
MLSEASPETTIGLYLKTYFLDLIKTKQVSAFRWDSIDGLLVNASPPKSWQYTTAFPIVGTAGADDYVHQSACVVTHRTQYAGRSYRGRHYIPGLNAAQYTNGLISTAARNAIQTYYDDIKAAVGSGGANTDIRWVVWSQKLLTYTDVTDTLVRTIPGVIRRRRVGVGV